MDRKMKSHKSLPPMVKGKIYGYLKFTVDEIIWSKRSFGEIKIFACWWGETTDTARFRPADITENLVKLERETTVVYAIRTNMSLFEEYIKNCECVNLSIVTEENDTVVGTSRITNLLEIFEFKPLFKYIPIISNDGNDIGKIHVSMKLECTPHSFLDVELKTSRPQNEDEFNCISLPITGGSFKRNRKDTMNDEYDDAYKKFSSEGNETYKSILKSRRTKFRAPFERDDNETMDKLVARAIAKAQKLRGAILRETCNEEVSDFDDSLRFHVPTGDGTTKLRERYLDSDASNFDERKVLRMLRSSMSPTLNFVDCFASDDRSRSYEPGNEDATPENACLREMNSSLGDRRCLKEELRTKGRETSQSNPVNYIRVFVESFALSPAGYRRVKSSASSHNDGTLSSATYFVRYNVPFGRIERKEQKSRKENRHVSVRSRKQTNRVIYFDHDGIYRISKLKSCAESYCIRFKTFIRHLDRKSSTELGTGTVYVNDTTTRNEHWSTARNLIIANRGIKIGELSVIVEFGTDPVYFANRCVVSSVASSKENVSIGETRRVCGKDETNENMERKRATEIRSKMIIKGLPTCTDKDANEQKIDAKDRENNVADKKILLHGLVYVPEGKELPESSTYLICRAFRKEDKSRSQICTDTKNPSYRFCQVTTDSPFYVAYVARYVAIRRSNFLYVLQLVPLVRDSDMLDRIKDNYVVIEVHYENNDVDNLLGLTRLPVHRLYMAYRDQRALPRLLLSKYPVVSVDGWVPIIDPITGRSCGELLALVALGTAEQIDALLSEASRGLRDIVAFNDEALIGSENIPNCARNMRQVLRCNARESESNGEPSSYSKSDDRVYYAINITKEKTLSDIKSQECQTDVSTVKELKLNEKSQKESPNSENSVLRAASYGRSTQLFDANKTNADRIVRTDCEMDLEEKTQANVPERVLRTNVEYTFDASFDESDSGSCVRHNFRLPTETYRSVGVGAEYDEAVNQRLNSNRNGTECVPSPTTTIRTEKETMDSTCDGTTFRAIVEIECALHLPEIEKNSETIAPSTYVSFQANKRDPSKQLNSYMITNVFPHSCDPKWNWKCDTELSVELLLHGGKRLILKIWNIFDANTSMQVNLEKDTVIGFSAVDLTSLLDGFPTVSGWFHIMDFAGKCNGQIKVCVTPLDNLSLLEKSSKLKATRISTCNVSRLSWSSLSHIHETYSDDTDKNDVTFVRGEDKSAYQENRSNDSITCNNLEDASTSFLSLSLKQKLIELDEITKRLKSRLRDVTSAAFQDDFENEFELNEANGDNDINDRKGASTEPDKRSKENHNVPGENEILNRSPKPPCSDSKELYNFETIESGKSSKVSDSRTKQNLSNDNYRPQCRNKRLIQDIKLLEKSCSDYPERGTKTHINCLLDKLSSQLPLRVRSTRGMSAKRNINDLLVSLQECNNDVEENVKRYNPQLEAYTVLAQTESANNEQHDDGRTTSPSTDRDGLCEHQISPESFAPSEMSNKMSMLIREELVTEENNDTSKCDDLTTYLVASNVRHMDLNDIVNPLLYQHLVPDLCYSKAVSSDDEAVERLDDRYVRIFTKLINSTLHEADSFVEIDASYPSENAEDFRTKPSEEPENIDDRIDLNVLSKSISDDLLASNDTESTTTISLEKLPIKSIDAEMLENGRLVSSQISIPVLSRQAPDGGNPAEDTTVKPSTA
ncbi:uncharacterized protein LOC143180554 isoform X2 [Calliopsis andreniformis]|uniref:uncharacterized protein LOC143180554 isoform X2 n=1 Tax=Calliopsis andreniformis TaxID=337506 RepID=UPI003FCC901A